MNLINEKTFCELKGCVFLKREHFVNRLFDLLKLNTLVLPSVWYKYLKIS